MTVQPVANRFPLTLDAMKKMNGLKIKDLDAVMVAALIESQVPVALRVSEDCSDVAYFKDFEVGRRYGKLIYVVVDRITHFAEIVLDNDDVDLNRTIVFEDWMNVGEKADLKTLNKYLMQNRESGVVRNFCEGCGNLALKFFADDDGDGNHFCEPCAQHIINDQEKEALEARGGAMPMAALGGRAPIARFDKPHDWQQSLREAEAGSRLVNRPFVSDMTGIDLTKDGKNG